MRIIGDGHTRARSTLASASASAASASTGDAGRLLLEGMTVFFLGSPWPGFFEKGIIVDSNMTLTIDTYINDDDDDEDAPKG